MRPILALVPSQKGSAVIVTAGGAQTIKGTDKLLAFLEQQEPSLVLGIMGGPQQNVMLRAVQLDHSVARVPWFRLFKLTGIARGLTPKEQGHALLRAWEVAPEAFYALGDVDGRMFRLREFTRTRLNIQQTFRIPASLQYQATLRDLEGILPEGEQFASIRRTFAEPAMIRGALEDEAVLEKAVKALTKNLPIWDWLHPGSDSVLPQVKGLGPSLGGSLIAEIGDIRRFPAAANLRSYARYSVVEGKMPRRQRGQVASWNNYLHRAVWLWSTDQMPRYRGTVWRDLYDYRKAVELRKHPTEELEAVTRRDNAVVQVPRYTLGHLDAMAKRYVGWQLLTYVYELWTAGLTGDPEMWYPTSRWPARFERARQELKEWGAAVLEEEVPKRRKVVAE